jgi:hypothetical protein
MSPAITDSPFTRAIRHSYDSNTAPSPSWAYPSKHFEKIINFIGVTGKVFFRQFCQRLVITHGSKPERSGMALILDEESC